jgi:hypothetical protein
MSYQIPTILAEWWNAFDCTCGKVHQLSQTRQLEGDMVITPCGQRINLILPDSTPVTDEITRMHIEGDVIHSSWYEHIRLKPTKRCPLGHPDTAAVLILAHIFYWYRETEIIDPDTNTTIGWKKKFHREKLERSYGELEATLGLTRFQARRAIKHLVKLGLIKHDFKKLTIRGMHLNNVMCLEPVPSKIRKITTYRAKKA